MIVKVREKGVKLNGIWKYQGEEAEIDEVQYEKNKEYVDIIEDEEIEELPQIPGEADEDLEENQEYDEEKELIELRAKGKELGIARASVMGAEKLKELIAEKEAPLFGQKNENPDGNDTDVETSEESADTDIEIGDNEEETGEDNPQE